MGRVDANPPPQPYDQSPTEPPLEDYQTPHEEAYMADNDQNENYQSTTRSYVPPSNESTPPPEAYPPPKPASYPPQQQPASYPPQPVQFPPQQPQPVQFPPQQPQPVQFPPQQPQPAQFPPQPQPVHFAPQPTGFAQPQTPGYIQTPVANQYLAPTQDWSANNGLFDCANDPENALITACFPCITFGQIAEIVDNGQTSCTSSGLIYCLIGTFLVSPCLVSCSYRTKIRNRYGLMETPAPDWVTHCFCEWCALCQEYRELKIRGMDPAIGWQGNMMRKQMQQFSAMTPPMNQTMQ